MSIDDSDRPWRLWQVETALCCNIDCIMCPWRSIRRKHDSDGIMSSAVWNGLYPYLKKVASIDFSGGGEPLLQPRLTEWMGQAHEAGCETGFLSNGLLLDNRAVQSILAAGVDWIAVSMDGATADIYERIRKGSHFERVCSNIKTFSSVRNGKKPKLALNFVIMPENVHQLQDMVRLAGDLGVDQVNFKQCDVIRGQDGKGHGLFSDKASKVIRRLKKKLSKAERLARKLKLQTTAFPFVLAENPVCDQDPRDSLFIRSDGYISPCISLAYGGASSFSGESVFCPTLHFGRLPEEDLFDIWAAAHFNDFRQQIEQRVRVHDAVIGNSSFEPSLIKLGETLRAAVAAMPGAPEGCSACHYLFNTSKTY
jgi:MoaA/NifB/PqqE/SkfB family radical SAM enzyme